MSELQETITYQVNFSNNNKSNICTQQTIRRIKFEYQRENVNLKNEIKLPLVACSNDT